jgi:hypothetical protein
VSDHIHPNRELAVSTPLSIAEFRMSRRSWKQRIVQAFRRLQIAKKGHQGRSPRSLSLEPLSARLTPAVNTFFVAGTGVLSIINDNANNVIEVCRNAAGQIRVNGGAVAINGGTPTVANTGLIKVCGLGGNVAIRLNEANGALPLANLNGGDGNDTLTGGAGDDVLLSGLGLDILDGGDCDDTEIQD